MSNDLKQTVLEQLQTAAKPVATALGMQQLIPVDLTGLGNLPWFWQNGLRFNAKTFNWLNHLFAFKEGTYAARLAPARCCSSMPSGQ
ncbi:hypothetical protein [Pseudomonas sp. RIT-PI-S]|uniref:hypothetical protein n=1 Tax=Pseudomonas sp. RIT-PI-S TaxID=3035295 RepID=UPI0021D9CC75|nr:hypothetical protein [Pseudomonas sp. RIT-PI-S]